MSIIEKELLNTPLPIFTYEQVNRIVNQSIKSNVLAFEKWVMESEYQRSGVGFVRQISSDKYKTFTTEEIYDIFEQRKQRLKNESEI